MEQQGGLLDHLYLIIINVLLDSLLEGVEATVGEVPIIMVNFQNHGLIAAVPVVT